MDTRYGYDDDGDDDSGDDGDINLPTLDIADWNRASTPLSTRQASELSAAKPHSSPQDGLLPG